MHWHTCWCDPVHGNKAPLYDTEGNMLAERARSIRAIPSGLGRAGPEEICASAVRCIASVLQKSRLTAARWKGWLSAARCRGLA